MHKLLKRQIRRTLGSGVDLEQQPECIRRLLDLVDAAYAQSDEDRRMLERTLDLSSAELLEANGELDALVRSLPDLFLRVDSEQRTADLRGSADDNPSLVASAARGAPLRSCLVPPAAEAVEGALAAMNAGRLRAAEVSYEVLADGEERHFEARLRRLPGDDVMIVIRDVTDGVIAARAEALRREEAARGRALEEFAYVASHDLRAPLRGVANLAEWLEEDLAEIAPEESKERFGLLRRRVQRMDDLLVALLDYARVGREEVQVEVIDSSALVSGVVDMLGNDRFTFEVAEMPTIETARGPLERVFLNLITNAIKHHDREDGCIRVGSLAEPLRFYVEDDGPGIPAAARERVFKMFQKLARRDAVEGSGMGLALIRRIVAEAGGQVHLEDAASGRGCRFVFTWPATWRRPSEAAPESLVRLQEPQAAASGRSR